MFCLVVVGVLLVVLGGREGNWVVQVHFLCCWLVFFEFLPWQIIE